MTNIRSGLARLQQMLGRSSKAQAELIAFHEAREKRLKTLGSSLAFLTETLNSANDGMLAVHFASGAKYINSKFTEIWGQTPEAFLAPGQETALLTLHATMVKDSEQFVARAKELWTSVKEDVFEEIAMKDGRLVERTITPVIAHGKQVGLVINFRDVTQRSRSERKISFNRLVVENASPLFWLDPVQGRIVYANKAACEHLAYDLENFIGLQISVIDPSADAEKLAALNTKLKKSGKPCDFESRFVRGDGGMIDVETTLFLAEDEERALQVVAFKDVTEHKRAANELARERNTMRTLVGSIPDLIFYKDHEGRYLGCNDAYAVLVGRTSDEIKGLSCEHLFSADVAAIMRARDDAVMQSQERVSSEHWVVYPDGRRALLDTCVRPFTYEDGKPGGLLGVSRDITNRKDQEDATRFAKESAEDATRMKSNFLANMSHEIRTPMNAIIGLSHLALKTDLTPRQRDYITKVNRSGQHLLGIINDILDFSKVEAGKMTLENIDFELEKTLDNAASLIAEKCSAKGVELVLNIAPDVPQTLVGDSLRLGQVLINYANNAVKYTDAGEIVISVSVADRTLEDVVLRFSVRDTGLGLTDEQISRLFQSFSQADSSTTRKFGGTGLGLAISKQLAELMGGQVGVSSVFGAGSDFWFTVRMGIGQQPKRALLPNLDLRGRRALVVDDNENARSVIRGMLMAMTFDVVDVDSGRAAINALCSASAAKKPFDVVYLDWRMPLMDGMETARQIRALALVPEPTLVMVSAYAREEMIKEATSLGIVNMLVKPLTPSMLFDTTVEALGSKREEAKINPTRAAANIPHLAHVQGSRVLLVEDNEVNQQIASELLIDAGFVVEVAGNGQIAVDMVQSRSFDLVLMDMQMPVMDGLSATEAIRRISRLEKLPIIAMTANAMEKDRISCLKAGMNDFLTKPINPDEMWRMMLKWIQPAAPAQPAVDPAIAAAEKDDDLPKNVPGLDVRLGLKHMMGKKTLYLAMLQKFVKGQQSCVPKLREALAAEDQVTAQRIAHTLKGVSATLGATVVADHAAAVEHAIRMNLPAAELALAISALESPLATLMRDLEAWLVQILIPK